MKLRTVIVEDERPSLNRLKELLSHFEHIEIVGTAGDGEEAVQIIEKEKPDLAFLDVQLPVFSSFEVLNRINYRPDVIFITAYDDHAIKAFEENAIDYLLKPTNPERLKKAIDRVIHKKQSFNYNLIDSLNNLINNEQYLNRFSIKSGNEYIFINCNEIFYFQAKDKYVFLNTDDRQFLTEYTLKQLNRQLDPKKFIRIHKSLIVSIDKIRRVKRTLSGSFKIELNKNEKTSLEIGRTFLPAVREQLNF